MRLVVTTMMIFFVTVWATAQTVTFNRSYEDDDGNLPLSVYQTNNGYFSLGSGWFDLIDGWRALKIMKYDLNGNLLLTRYFGEEYWGCFPGYNGNLQMTDDGNYLFSGYKVDTFDNFNFWLVKFDENGDTLWTKTIDLGGEEFYYNNQVSNNGDIICIGSTTRASNVQEQLYIACYDRNGNFKWEKLHGNSGYDGGYYIEKTLDNGFIVGGASESRGWDGWLVKMDSVANIQWQRSFGTTGYDSPLGVVVNPEGGYFVWGNYDSLVPGSPLVGLSYLYKLDSLGMVAWEQYYPTDYNSKGITRARIYDGYLYFCGITDDNLENDFQGWFVKMTLDGSILWERKFYNPNSPENVRGDWFEDFQRTQDGGFILTGPSSNLNRNPNSPIRNRTDFWLVKLDSNGCLYPTTACVNGITETATLQAKLYPNPTTGTLTIELPNGQGGNMALYNLLGQSVYQTTLAGGQTTLALNLPPGLYLYRITSGGKAVNGKLLVE